MQYTTEDEGEQEQRNRESNLESNAAQRAKLAARNKEPALVVPDEVLEWFDRARIAYLYALEQKHAGNSGSNGSSSKSKKEAANDELTALHVSYVKQKFERRGLFLWSVFQKVLVQRFRYNHRGLGVA